MSEHTPALPPSEPAQSEIDLGKGPGLEPGWELVTLEEDKRAGRCTGARVGALESRRREILDACATLGTRRVADYFGISREAVRALRTQAMRSGELGQAKQRMGRDFLALADAARERLLDQIDSVPLGQLAIVAGIATDKGLILSGEATARIEHQHTVTVSHADLADELAAFPEAIEVQTGPAMGYGAGASGAKGDALPVGLGADLAVNAARSDSQSVSLTS